MLSLRTMQVILLQDVAGVGKKYDVKILSNGYARNFLFPRKLAILATPQDVKKLEMEKARLETEKKIQQDLLKKNLQSLEGLKITIDVKENEQGHLFAGIHAEEISRAIKEQHHLDIPPEIIEMTKPIKEIGEYKIKAKGQEFVLEII